MFRKEKGRGRQKTGEGHAFHQWRAGTMAESLRFRGEHGTWHNRQVVNMLILRGLSKVN